MNTLTDTTMLCLAVALILGGVALGFRFGAVAALWAAGGAWLALRFADRMWKPVFLSMRDTDPALDIAFWLPLSYALMFAGFLGLVVAWIVWVKPKQKEFLLPSKAGEVAAIVSGAAAGALIVLAAVQSQVMSPEVEKRLGKSLEIARPVLAALGQKHLAAPARPAGAAGAGRGAGASN